jgi:hypothetical protein
MKPKDLKDFESHTIWFGKLVEANNKIIVKMTTKDRKETKAVVIPVLGPSDWRLKNLVGDEIAFSLIKGSDGKYYLDLVLQKLPFDILPR